MTSQFRRPQYPGTFSGGSTRSKPLERGRTGGTVSHEVATVDRTNQAFTEQDSCRPHV